MSVIAVAFLAGCSPKADEAQAPEGTATAGAPGDATTEGTKSPAGETDETPATDDGEDEGAEDDGEDKDETTSTSNSSGAGMTLAVYKNEKGELACPVMGTVIASADKAAGSAEYEGKKYYFCCGACPGVFDKDKEKYAK